MTVVTVANKAPTEPYYTYHQFFASLRRYGVDPLVLGMGPGEYQGLASKPRLLKRALESGQVKGEWMIFCDCFDVVFAAPPVKIAETARAAYGNCIVWNAERNCFPDASLASQHPETTRSFRYLNSGFAVGPVADFLKLLRWMDADNLPVDHQDSEGRWTHPNDQDYFMRAFLFSGIEMKLDSECRVCQALCGVAVDEMEISKGRITNKETGSSPLAWHWNGPAKTAGLREPILNALEL